MKRYSLRAAVHDARVLYRLRLEYRGPIGTGAKIASVAGSHDTRDNQSRLTKAALGDVLQNNIGKPNENRDNSL